MKRTHGCSGNSRTSEYAIWLSMKARCYNPLSKPYNNYGGRGITVCERWRESFQNFMEDMGPRPPGMTIERLDNNGIYAPSNCKWATRKEQGVNKRNNRLIEYHGRRLTLSQWASETNISRQTLYRRLLAGWSVEESLLCRVQ